MALQPPHAAHRNDARCRTAGDRDVLCDQACDCAQNRSRRLASALKVMTKPKFRVVHLFGVMTVFCLTIRPVAKAIQHDMRMRKVRQEIVAIEKSMSSGRLQKLKSPFPTQR